MNLAADPDLPSLRERLKETEDICHAISAGEVDAVVVGRSDEDKRVLLMSGAYTRYRQIVEDMIQGAVTVSAGSGEILFANHAFARMLGENLLDVFRTPLHRWVTPAFQEQAATAARGRIGQRDVLVELQRRGREPLPVSLSPVSASDDFVTLLITAVPSHDLEEARATLEAIRSGSVDAFVVDGKQVRMLDSAQAPYRVLVEQMRQGAATVDHDGVVVYANERLVTMLAKPLGHLLGTRLADHVVEGDRHALRMLLAGRNSAQADLRLQRSNGDPTLVQATMTALDGHKLLLFTDVSERKRHEASDERTRKFLGMLAHEFRNILSPISNSAEVLKRNPSLDADGRKAVEMIERQTARLVSLVDELRRINPKE